MCILNLSKEKKARGDIICYKYVYKHSNNVFTPYFRLFWYIKDEVYEAREFMPTLSKGFHSYTNKKDPIRKYIFRKNMKKASSLECVVKCIIPKGSTYFVGEDLTGLRNYISNKIKIVEIIKE